MKRAGMTPKTPCRSKAPSKDSLQVYCRLRPMPSLNDVSCVTVVSDTTLQLTSPETAVNFRNGMCKETQYSFNRVFDENTSQKCIFDEVCLPLVEQLVKGRNGLLFTYGVTGSGKTYTMTGVPSDGGIMPRCLDVLFNSISEYQSRKYIFKPDKMNGFEVQTEQDAIKDEEVAKGIRSGKLRRKESEEDVRSVRSSRTKDETRINGIEEDNSYAVFITYIEVYNNSVFDLLENLSESDVCSKFQMKIVREDGFRNMYVHAVTEVEVKDANEAFEIFYKGQKRKRMAHTTLNTESSRSHSVFTIRLVQAPLDIRGENVLQDKKMIAISQLSLVDLAGSERTNRTKNCGQRLREAGNINNSLMTLRSCLEILRENQVTGGNKIIPYRESKLTHLFKNYFDGEGVIRMVVCVNPRVDDYDETVQVMKFAEVSQEIQVPRATPMKTDMAIGLTPGRRKAHQAYKKAVQIFEEEIKNVPGHVPDDVAVIYSLGSFPSLESTDPLDEETNKKLISYLEERIKRMDALKEDMNSRADRFRAALLNHEQNFSRLQQENEYFKAIKEQDINKIKNLNSKIVQMDSNILSLKRKVEEIDDENKRLKREVSHKDTLVNQYKLEKEREKRKYNAKIVQKTERLAKEIEQQTKENREIESKLKAKTNKLRTVKNFLKEDNSSDDFKIKRPRNAYTDDDDDATSRSSGETYGTAADNRKEELPVIPVTEKNLYGVSVSNPRYRRSRSVSDDRWLHHNPLTPVPLNTVFQPQIKKRKSFSKVTSPEQMKEMSKYCLMTQNQDEMGDLETHLVKGDVIPTAGGGAQVVFNDVETLKQSSPISSPVRHMINAYNQTVFGTPSVPAGNVSNKCSISIEGHANK